LLVMRFHRVVNVRRQWFTVAKVIIPYSYEYAVYTG
jgi:hypothetical protein